MGIRLAVLSPVTVLLNVFILGRTSWLVVWTIVGLVAMMVLRFRRVRSDPRSNRPFILQLTTVTTLVASLRRGLCFGGWC